MTVSSRAARVLGKLFLAAVVGGCALWAFGALYVHEVRVHGVEAVYSCQFGTLATTGRVSPTNVTPRWSRLELHGAVAQLAVGASWWLPHELPPSYGFRRADAIVPGRVPRTIESRVGGRHASFRVRPDESCQGDYSVFATTEERLRRGRAARYARRSPPSRSPPSHPPAQAVVRSRPGARLATSSPASHRSTTCVSPPRNPRCTTMCLSYRGAHRG